jgi:hypothetical protein
MAAPLTSRPSRADADRAYGLCVLLVLASMMTAVKSGVPVADWWVLRHLYGPARVAAEHLTIVKHNPRLVVSNGDVPEDFGLASFLVASAVMMLGGPGLSLCLWLLMPRAFRAHFLNRPKDGGMRWGLVLLIPCTIPLCFVPLPLWINAAALAALVGAGWLLFRRRGGV